MAHSSTSWVQRPCLQCHLEPISAVNHDISVRKTPVFQMENKITGQYIDSSQL